jgi:hypothetical protein
MVQGAWQVDVVPCSIGAQVRLPVLKAYTVIEFEGGLSKEQKEHNEKEEETCTGVHALPLPVHTPPKANYPHGSMHENMRAALCNRHLYVVCQLDTL